VSLAVVGREKIIEGTAMVLMVLEKIGSMFVALLEQMEKVLRWY
jgi:hypothetical protein